MAKIIKLRDAKTDLARLVQIAQHARQRVPGEWEGRLWISDDFDAPLPREIRDAFGGPTPRQ